MQRHRILIALAVVLVSAVSAYACLPQLRLWVHGSTLREASAGHWIDAHRYDPEWFDAARAGRVDILQALHDAHYPIDTQNGSGFTAVVLSSYDDQPEALTYLLTIGASACVADHNGNTALMGAIYKGHIAIAEKLMQTGCPIDQVNNAGETALSFAVLFGRKELLNELMRRGADLDHRDAQGQTPLAIAAKQDNRDMVEMLRQLGARD